MNKEFFEALEKRATDFAARAGVDSVRTELALATGRTYVIDRVVEVTESWLQVDGHETGDRALPLSIVLPYHQISHVLLTRERAREAAGIRPGL